MSEFFYKAAVRIAIVDKDRCKRKDCNFECNIFCPVVRAGREIVVLDSNTNKAIIDEDGCIGCGICVKKCPFKAIEIVNLTSEPVYKCIHQYGPNTFRLYGLPQPQQGKTLGIIGVNGAGKTTSINILSGRIKPNFGNYSKNVDIDYILDKFKGKWFYRYFKLLYSGSLRVSYKPQNIHMIMKFLKGNVSDLLKLGDERGVLDEVVDFLRVKEFINKDVKSLSGGELQRMAIAIAYMRDATAYFFDEPSSYLDVYQRMKAAKLIRGLTKGNKIVVVVDHDLAFLDYVSDMVSVIYGKPKVFGIASKPYAIGSGVNHYLEGYLPAENLRIRKAPIRFELKKLEATDRETKAQLYLKWSTLKVHRDSFNLEVEGGELYGGEVVGVLGPNAIGKTTFVRTLIGEIQPDKGTIYSEAGEIILSYKPQVIEPPDMTVREYIIKQNKEALNLNWYVSEVLEPLQLMPLMDRTVPELSGGELQAVTVAGTIAKNAHIYFFDEPSAFLDVEQRITLANIIRKLAEVWKRAVLVVDHDLIIHDFAASKIILFKGEPGFRGHASKPLSLKAGINEFLKDIQITFRRDPKTGRPRINKEGSWMDRYQKRIGEYYYLSPKVPKGAIEEE